MRGMTERGAQIKTCRSSLIISAYRRRAWRRTISFSQYLGFALFIHLQARRVTQFNSSRSAFCYSLIRKARTRIIF